LKIKRDISKRLIVHKGLVKFSQEIIKVTIKVQVRLLDYYYYYYYYLKKRFTGPVTVTVVALAGMDPMQPLCLFVCVFFFLIIKNYFDLRGIILFLLFI
jgi:hypothetical protein